MVTIANVEGLKLIPGPRPPPLEEVPGPDAEPEERLDFAIKQAQIDLSWPDLRTSPPVDGVLHKGRSGLYSPYSWWYDRRNPLVGGPGEMDPLHRLMIRAGQFDHDAWYLFYRRLLARLMTDRRVDNWWCIATQCHERWATRPHLGTPQGLGPCVCPVGRKAMGYPGSMAIDRKSVV